MKTSYISHDQVYRRQKAEGRPGWGDADIFRENVATLREALRRKYVPKTGRLLELGCGAGELTLWLAEEGYEVYGVDIAPTAIEWAREKAEELGIEADFRLGNVLDLNGYSDGYFAFALDGHCFHCIIGEDRKLLLASVRRVLEPGGLLLIVTMCGEVTNPEVRKWFDPESRCLVRDGIAVRYIGLPDDILAETRDAGFKVLDWEIKSRKDEADQDDLLVWAIS